MSHTKHHFDENLCTAITFRLAIPLTNKSQEAQESSFFRRIAQALLTITNAQPHELLPTLNIIIDDVRNERPYRQDYPINEHGIIRVDNIPKERGLQLTVITDCPIQTITQVLQCNHIDRTLDDIEYAQNPAHSTYLYYT